MGSKAVEPKLYLSFSLDAAVPANHIVRRLAAAVDFGFVRGLTVEQDPDQAAVAGHPLHRLG